MTKQEHQKILEQINQLRIEYRKKFGKGYGIDMESSLDVEYTLADLKDCIENNHLQKPRKEPRPSNFA